MFLNLHLLGAPFDKQGLAGKIAANKAADQWQPGWLPLVFELSENELEAWVIENHNLYMVAAIWTYIHSFQKNKQK